MPMFRFMLMLVVAASLGLPLLAQDVWLMQESGTTAGLRGIDSVDGTVAWASGTGGTVLRTVDGGLRWTQCAVPDGDKDGATLDFRGVQAWDATTAIVMASGPGDKSRLYKTSDGCKTWKLVFTNPDKDGFWDALIFGEVVGIKRHGNVGMLLGDPVDGAFTLFEGDDSGKHWIRQRNKGLAANVSKQGVFAASNSSLITLLGTTLFGSGGSNGAFVYSGIVTRVCIDYCSDFNLDGSKNEWNQTPLPLGTKTESSGIFSIGLRMRTPGGPLPSESLIAVGGEYTKPNEIAATAAWSLDGGKSWTASTNPPHGYRSTVQWSESLKIWITAGTNGSDISRDDGKTWKPLDNGNWNALSLPFVVGPKGRIGRLNPAAIPKP